jgi:hypothetical protein
MLASTVAGQTQVGGLDIVLYLDGGPFGRSRRVSAVARMGCRFGHSIVCYWVTSMPIVWTGESERPRHASLIVAHIHCTVMSIETVDEQSRRVSDGPSGTERLDDLDAHRLDG